MESSFTPELLQAAQAAKTAEELQTLAKEHGRDITLEQAQEYYEQLHKSGELEDDELDNVSGGCGGGGGEPEPKDFEITSLAFTVCQHFICYQCGRPSETNPTCLERMRVESSYHLGPRKGCDMTADCRWCKHKYRKEGKFYCDHPDNRGKTL